MDYQTFFKKANEKQISNIQITEKKTTDSSIEIINGKIESFEDYNNTDYAIKAEYNGKTVKTSSNYLDIDILDWILMKAKETDSVYEDEYLERTENIPSNKPLTFDISEEIKRLKELDSLRNNKVEKLTTYFSESYTNTRIINSQGVDLSTDSHLCQFMAEAIVEKNGEYTSYDRQVLTTNKKEINFEEIIKDVEEKAILQSTKEKLKTGKYNIILDSYVAGRITSHLVNMLSAMNIRDKVSCLENKLGEKVFSNTLTIIEDPTNQNFPGYRLFDDEGTKTYQKDIIKDGVIETYLYNIKEAKRAKTTSTGNGYQGIGTKNMVVLPGKESLEELMRDMKDGLYIIDYMGASGTSINTVTGSISLQVFGFLIKEGKIVSGIEPSIMTTTIFELLSNIEKIGNDIKFTNTATASPSLYINNISIAR